MKTTVNGIELFYEKTGSGSPVILLHGNGEDHSIFDKLSDKLKNDFTIYAIDSRNHGESSKTDDYAYTTMARDIYEFIQELGLGKVNLLGFSDGAIIGLILAMEHSEVLNKMALLGPNLSPSDFTDESYQFLKEEYKKNKDPLFALMLEQPNISTKDISIISTPSLVIGGENDIFKPETFTNIASAISNSKLLILKDHTHDSYITNQDILYDDIKEFFQ